MNDFSRTTSRKRAPYQTIRWFTHARVAILLLSACVLQAGCGTGAVPPSTAAPNMVIEARGTGLARLTVELSAKGKAQPVMFEYKATDGMAAGGIAIPNDVPSDYVVTGFDEAGRVTHMGKGSIPAFVNIDRPLALGAPSVGEGEGVVVSLTRERLVIEATPTPGQPGDLALRAQVFDAQGNAAKINPGDLRWQLSDGRYVDLVPNPRDGGLHYVPRGTTPTRPVPLCELRPDVYVCLPNGHCVSIKVCADPFVSISAGGSHTCALTKSGAAYCWGSNIQGELGAPTTTTCGPTAPACSTRPLAVACPAGAPCRFTQISSGQTLTAAVDTNGDVWWWGRGAPGHHKVTAVLANAPVKFSMVAAGYGHACALSQARSEIWCWGTNAYGESGAPRTTLEVTTPNRVLAPLGFKKIAAGGEHACAISTTDVVCWGRDDWHQSSGPNSTQAPPSSSGPFYFQQFGGLVSVVDVATSATSTCVGLGGGVRCWGENGFGTYSGFGTVDRVTAGIGQVCALTNQVASCMGSNNWGELGIGSHVLQTTPVAVHTPPALYAALSAGDAHTCGVTPSGDAYCWGGNLLGQVGNGAFNYDVKEPAKVVSP